MRSLEPGQVYYTSKWLYLRRRLLQYFFRILFHILCRVRVSGKENVPKSGPYIVAINHISLFDPPLALAFFPYPPEAMGAADLLHRPGQRQLLLLYRGILVNRDDYDRGAVSLALAALRAGYPLALAPEGGRSHAIGMRQAHAGVAYLIDKTGVPVIPVGCVGTTDDMLQRALRFQKPRVELRIGKPFTLPPVSGTAAERRDMRQQNADAVMLKIAELLPPEYHGYYAGQVAGTPAREF